MHTLKTFIAEHYLSESKKHPIFAKLKLPGGENAQYNHEKGEYEWSKYGGYANNVMDKLRGSLPKYWKKIETTDHNTPDGSVMGHGTHYRRGEHVLTVRSSYGGTKHDNYHSIEVRHRPIKK